MGKDENRDDWIRLPSKSHPRRFYLFNKATGETKWIPSKGNEKAKEEKQQSPPKLSINKASRTPAQDRLKRLQTNLRLCQTKTLTPKSSKEQENEFAKDGPSTSSSAKAANKSPKKPTKRAHGAIFPNENDTSAKCCTSSPIDDLKKLPPPNSSSETSLTPPSNEPVVDCSIETSRPSKESLTRGNVETSSSTFSKLRSGITKTIKEICKIPFNFSKKIANEKNKLPSELIYSTKNKAISKTKPKQMVSSATKEALIKQIREEKSKILEDKILSGPLTNNTPKDQEIPSYPRGSANSRLERLKQSLLSQQQSLNRTNSSATSNVASCSSTSNHKTILPQEDIQFNSHFVSNNTANNTENNEAEPMDWQPIVMEKTPIEKSASEPTLVVEKSKKLLLKDVVANENQTMGDIIDTVNENLLRFSAEKPKGSINNNKKWRKDFYYFIVDTNVLLRDLTFVEDLSEMQLCDTKGSMLYIPYSVLQELDKLKMRSKFQEGVKTLAVRAIKYLNSKFESNSPNVQAQSALDERNHLIDINSADDSILNCCLQAKEHVPNLILLTEDINLRNKAISNNIIVSAKSDLTVKRYVSSDNP